MKISADWLSKLVDRVNPSLNNAVALTSGYTGSITVERLGDWRKLQFQIFAPSSAGTGNLQIATLAATDQPAAEAYGTYVRANGTRITELARITTTGAIVLDGSPGNNANCYGTVYYFVA
ncbi:MAG: hypothetical protein L0G87_11680 [Renibacterium salmoninarum]|nr:hypothetical protein [Renibacterium salmoninarum]